ncbi:ABC transporter permease [Pelagibacterium mangrovi]|uniref:ABC transporter permease n=1 Tax=Pelagibacterium mangrovi TaxID=3119828 RepID=UPI002FC6B979
MSALTTTRWAEIWAKTQGLLFGSATGLLGAVLLLLICAIGVLAPWISPFDPNTQFSGLRLVMPGDSGHILGTDELSRDLLSRLIHGTRTSLMAGVASVTVGAAIGVILGMVSAVLGGRLDAVVMRTCDVILAYPGILLGIVAVAVLGPGLFQVCVAIAVINIPVFARLMRSAALREHQLDYVKAALVQGASLRRILFVHIMPNSVGVVITQISAAVGHAVLLEASLSFLGLGVQAPTASLGAMLNKSRDFLGMAPMYAIAPGLMLFVLVLGLNFFTDALQKALNPTRGK